NSWAIKGYVNVLSKHISADNHRAMRLLEDIRSSAEEIETIPTKGWLPENLEVATEPIVVDAILGNYVQSLCQSHPGIDPSFQLSCGHIKIAVNREFFELALEKLINNAIQ